eukprot:gene5818-9641_t
MKFLLYFGIPASIIGSIGYLYPEESQASQIGGLFQVLEGSVRLGRVAYQLMNVTLDYKLTLKGDNWNNQELVDEVHERSAKRILNFCETNGGIYIKAGQYIASLNHIIPKQYVTVLSVLFNQAPFVDFEQVKKLIEQDFQRPFDEIFKEFEKSPIAAASVAQVHKAITNEGKEVAVKVQYPKVRRCFEGDMLTHELIMWGAAKAFPGWDFRWVGPEMHKALKAEMDFNYEAENAKITAEHLKNNKNVFVPLPLKHLSTQRVLTTEFIHGCKPTDLVKLREMGLSPKDVSQYVCEAFSEQIFTHGFLHGDPHAGNIIIRKVNGKPQVVIIDHGLYQILTPSVRESWCKIWKSFVAQDTPTLEAEVRKLGVQDVKLFCILVLMRNYDGVNVGVSKKMSKKQVEKFQEGMRKSMEKMVNVLKSLPIEVMLILRNNNLLRMINLDLGNPVNRFSLMSRAAMRGLMHNDKDQSILGRISNFKSSFMFEFKLKMIEIFHTVLDMYARFLIFIGWNEPLNVEDLVEAA